MVINSPWDSVEKLHIAHDYVNSVYERLLPLLGTALNDLHGFRRSERFWRIVLGPWLLLYLPVVYDRYMRVQAAIDEYPDLTTTVLSENEWLTPRNTVEFVELLKEDCYNLQLYSKIFKAMGKDFPRNSTRSQTYGFASAAKPSGSLDRQKILLVRLLIAVNRVLREGHSVIFRDSYFSWNMELNLILTSFGNVWPIIGRPTEAPQLELHESVRMKLQNFLPRADGFERLLSEMLPMDIPICFIEGFDSTRRKTVTDYPSRPKAVFSAIAWYYDEAFKQWAADCAEKGTKLFGVQHGGNYGSLTFHPSENHEISITDSYLSWGWRKETSADKVIPFYASKLSGRKILKADNNKKGILFAATSAPRFLVQFPRTPERFNEYLSWQFRFIKQIPASFYPDLRVRLHREDLGWDIADRWQDSCPEAKIEGWDVTFQQSLKTCRIYIADHLETTFLESLSANKPTILFWNPEINELRPEAEPYYERLRAAGILYDSPESAARALSGIYGDVETWWNQPQRQATRISFCERFAATSPHALRNWRSQFRQIAKTGMASVSLTGSDADV